MTLFTGHTSVSKGADPSPGSRVQKHLHTCRVLGRRHHPWCRGVLGREDTLNQGERNSPRTLWWEQKRPIVGSAGCRRQNEYGQNHAQAPQSHCWKPEIKRKWTRCRGASVWTILSSLEITGPRGQWYPTGKRSDKIPVKPEFYFQKKHPSETKAEMKTFSDRD